MPGWIPHELHQIAPLTASIGACKLPRTRPPLSSALTLSLSQAIPLLADLGGATRAVLVRQLLRSLGFDEYRYVPWRLEHKLVQALVMHSYLPGIMPVTAGLNSFLANGNAAAIQNGNYFVKPALGDSSGEYPNCVEPVSLVSRINHEPLSLLDEEYIIQERILIAREYRVHSLEDLVIEDLTFRRYEGGSIPRERDPVNAFVQSILDRLPDGLVGASLLAWDVALTPEGTFIVIEVNFSGFHPVFKRGFHCSGYYHDQKWGACDTARLLNHVARTHRVDVFVLADSPDRPYENWFYAETAAWQRRHKAARCLTAHSSAGEESQVSCLIDEIEAFTGPRRSTGLEPDLQLSLSTAIPLLPDLAASTRALLVRQLLRACNFDERRLGRWRLEHKLIQALVFRHYFRDSMPETCGLDHLACGIAVAELRDVLLARFPSGFVIKTALGDSAGNDCDYRTEAVLSWIEKGGRAMPQPGPLIDEEFIVQERKAIRHEYRVHTVEDRVIEDLTVRRHAGAVGPGERKAPNNYVQTILNALPAGVTAGSILGWDIALTEEGSCTVIEVNVGGLHTVYNPGFHSSGFYHHQHYGCVYTARLLLFMERAYGSRITVVADAPEYVHEHYFYSQVAEWKSRF